MKTARELFIELTWAPRPEDWKIQAIEDWAASIRTEERERCEEIIARSIYNDWKEKCVGWKPWVPGGNSLKQDEARALAKAALKDNAVRRGSR